MDKMKFDWFRVPRMLDDGFVDLYWLLKWLKV